MAWQFEQKGVVVVDAGPDDAEDVALAAIDAGADDFEAFETALHVYSAPGRLEEIRRTLWENGASIKSSEISMLPTNTVTLDEKMAMRTLKLLDRLEELSDIQKVFSNADFPDAVLEQYQSQE